MSEPSAEPKSRSEMEVPLLRRVLTIVLTAALLLAGAASIVGFTKTWVLALVNAAVAGLLLQAVRRGLVQTASISVVLVLILTALYAMATGQGVHDDSLLLFPNAFLLASLLLGGVSVVVVVVLSCSGIAAIGIGQIEGVLQPLEASRVAYLDILEIAVLLGALAAFAHHVVTLMRRSIIEAESAHQSVRDILDATSEAIFIHDAHDGRIVEVNQTTLQMFGASRADLIGQAPFEMREASAEFDARRAADYLQRALTSGPQTFEWLARRKDGSSFWVEVGLRSARIAGAARVVAVVRDITERRGLEQQVREAEKLRVVGQLAGGIAHDFNNQLVGILGNAEFLRHGLLDNDELRECADSVLSSGQRAADLTRQLLAFARKGQRLTVPVDLHQLIREVIALGKRSVDKRINILQQLDATRPLVKGDPGALQNALLNLLLNARDAMPIGGTVSFRTEDFDSLDAVTAFTPTLPAGNYVIVTVSDTGVGMSPDVLARLFEPFFTTKETGTGMGLAAVQGTILQHQGAIAVDSLMGRGTRLRLCLPSTSECAVQEEPKSAPISARTGGRVLVIDDEPAVARVVALTLELGGIGADVCNRGLAGLEQYRQNLHGLVLLDMMMPDLDGVEVLRRLRQQNPAVKVVLMSGHASEAVQSRLEEFPDVTVVSKPFSPTALLEDVIKQLAR